MHLKSTLVSAAMVLSALASQSSTQVEARMIPPRPAPKVQIAILLDTSSSMNGLIRQAKSELWTIVNRFSESSLNGVPTQLEIALYEYGKDSIAEGEGYLRMVSSFSTDLDQLSEELFALTTNGGSEYAGLVIDRSVKELQWSRNRSDYKAIFIAGNEEFTQGPKPYSNAITNAVGQGIVVNTIHCGDNRAGLRGKWQHAAKIGQGAYLTIEQNHRVQQIATPFDTEIAQLSRKINDTYIGYGRFGSKKKARQAREDSNSASMGARRMASRAKAKAGRSYKNASWDLVDGVAEGTAEIESLSSVQLPKEMRSMNNAQRKQYVDKKAAKRKKLQARIKTLSEKREKFIVKAQKKSQGKRGADKTSTFERAVLKTINKQMKAKGYAF